MPQSEANSSGAPIPQNFYVDFLDDRCTIWLDLAGEELYKRGFERFVNDAPLKETIAAGMLFEAIHLMDPISTSCLQDDASGAPVPHFLLPTSYCLLDLMSGSGTFSLQNGLGLRLTAHRASGSSSLTAQTATAAEQNFYIDEADYPFFKILASRGRSHGLDLNNVSTANGTSINIWQYQDGTLPVHRQWLLLPLNASQLDTGIKDNNRETITNNRYYDMQGRRLTRPMKGIYIVNGRKVVIK